MKTETHKLRTDLHATLRGHFGELARYCAVPVATVGWWWVAGVPTARRAEVGRFARVIVALERRFEPHFARTLLQLFLRSAEDRRLLRPLLRRPIQRRRYRVIVRKE